MTGNYGEFAFTAMPSRGRRGVPARGDEQRGEERVEPRHGDQGEQQAPAPQGPTLPPPPLVDYGVFMQGLVQAMQTQAHTQAALKAQQAQKRPAAPFQRQERKKAAHQSLQRPAASGSRQVSSELSPSGKKECPHYRRAHGGMECWKLAGKCLKCRSSEHRIKDCPRLQQGAQRGAAPAPAAAAAPATG
ncbi:hypothetical protein Taro_048675 [Colocasia esculenta]|uniref:CCHC-type domain-containing protein n=1 Tax=Colocasia esculenta TaxID=4460 RepID=A0A843X8S8_COLES|nr:hypothetical protein [Colocasia esculenta]